MVPRVGKADEGAQILADGIDQVDTGKMERESLIWMATPVCYGPNGQTTKELRKNCLCPSMLQWQSASPSIERVRHFLSWLFSMFADTQVFSFVLL